MPHLDTAQFIGRTIDVPERAPVPSGPLAENLEDLWNSLLKRRRLCQHAVNRLLDLQTLLDSPALRDDRSKHQGRSGDGAHETLKAEQGFMGIGIRIRTDAQLSAY